jgi:hypothetical protein
MRKSHQCSASVHSPLQYSALAWLSEACLVDFFSWFFIFGLVLIVLLESNFNKK